MAAVDFADNGGVRCSSGALNPTVVGSPPTPAIHWAWTAWAWAWAWAWVWVWVWARVWGVEMSVGCGV